ncbi:hypothetical protein QLQ12_00020 [Actinoplanes sp. NEAU-A12]|uniref:Uncharacterized protein n=1 Tax=Actinoplanes sandaracinus TaxID=3045177 RepID=A0ABT6WB99_9ACTN|nr:hypothetical protein [Actinoplanes sandaracinus]MDI6096992.1 hypothetical protein [Actinoplanes sandaracinus]
MTRSPQHHSGPHQPRTQIALAVITGVLTGAIRALTDRLLTYLSTGS